MGFNAFVLISLIYGVIGLQAIYKIARSWQQTWDRNFTQQDRLLVDQAAFFVLVPISVALHEFGHAVAVWSFGGKVIDFGFYGFAGYVSYDAFFFTPTEQMIVAAAGTIINLVLCALALAAVMLWRPPMRAAINELLIQFAFISGINAFIVYPLLDLASGLNGDWRQMYDGGVPALTAVIVVVQAVVILFGWWFFTNPGPGAKVAQLTDVPPGLARAPMGGLKRGAIDTRSYSPTERTMYEAVRRVASGWPSPVKSGVQRFPMGTAMTLEWVNGSRPRVVAVRAFANGRADLVGFRMQQGDTPNATPQTLRTWIEFPDVDDLTLALRLAMEAVDREA